MMRLSWLLCFVVLAACDGQSWNNPYPASQAGANILYSAFTERPKHLDPVQSYSSNEYTFIAQIYQPLLQYHYFKRPYELVPFAAVEVPRPALFDAQGRPLPEDADAREVAVSEYTIRIRPGILYQPHPALATDEKGAYLYHNLQRDDLEEVYALGDFKRRGTRELIAADYVHQIKRLAHPNLHSPIFGLMSEYIVGLKGLAATLAKANRALPP
ncbi:MAG TPA: peptide ABC transporter substrate-binding protein, partial [Burkholderiales bacterium]|nr:peptide ABC transporter substrate-binding protein [Burkholderiales bacterium]